MYIPEKYDLPIDLNKIQDDRLINNHRKSLENRAINQLIDHKEDYSKKAYNFASRWMIFISIIIILYMSDRIYHHQPLITDAVLITLIGSTTVWIIGLFAIILRGTFTSKLIEDLSNELKSNLKQ